MMRMNEGGDLFTASEGRFGIMSKLSLSALIKQHFILTTSEDYIQPGLHVPIPINLLNSISHIPSVAYSFSK